MPEDWTTLAAMLNPREYNAQPHEPLYGRTEPIDAGPCHCVAPGLTFHVPEEEDGEVRCWKCGRPATAPC